MQWVTLYNNVLSNLYGKDRQEAVDAMDDDEAFDNWMKRYDKQRKRDQAESDTPRSKKGGTSVSKDVFLARSGRVYGEDNSPF